MKVMVCAPAGGRLFPRSIVTWRTPPPTYLLHSYFLGRLALLPVNGL